MWLHLISGTLLVERQHKGEYTSHQIKALLQVYDLASAYWKIRDIFDPWLSLSVTAIAVQVKMIVKPFIEFYRRNTDTTQHLMMYCHLQSVAKCLLVTRIFETCFHTRYSRWFRSSAATQVSSLYIKNCAPLQAEIIRDHWSHVHKEAWVAILWAILFILIIVGWRKLLALDHSC